MSTSAPTWQPAAADVTAYMTMHHVTKPQAEMALIKAHAAAQENNEPHRISSAAFIARIPVETWRKIQQASMSATPLGAQLHQGLLQLSASIEVIANNAELLGMLAALVTANVITADEKTQILSF